ncbi:MAG: MBOAT family protein [Lachnospiraceae bacterium]|nr:MBOAT family protein [Lachnospiraceae bacterium]
MAGIGIENLEGFNTLVFGSLEFLFRYLPVFLLLFYLVPKRFRNTLLFVYSIILYGMGEPKYVLLLLGMTAVNYLFGRGLEGSSEEKTSLKRKGCFMTAVSCNIILLLYFKISNAFDSAFLLPLGISFYTFKSISYLTDVYRLDVDAEKSFCRFGAYLCMFPQVVQGPIMRYNDALSGLRFDRCTLERTESGLRKLVVGIAAKVLIADRLGILWNDIQTIGFESISTPLAWLGAAGYSLQLYFDFAGYTLIAVGIGEMIGLPLIRNFDFPYASVTISEFYRRWHMTLGQWFRDYVYIPLGGNRKGKLKTCFNLFFVWFLTGFWHGNSLNFILWGLVLGIFIVAEKMGFGVFLKKHRWIGHLYVLFVIPLTWMIFAIPSMKELGIYFLRLFPFQGETAVVNSGDFMKEIVVFAPTLAAALLFCIPSVGRWFEKRQRNFMVTIGLVILFWLSVYQITNAVNNPFMYANF